MKERKRMKRGLLVFLFCLPLILYAILFIALEPYNYWGLRDDFKKLDLYTSVSTIRRMLRSDCENIFIGNSKIFALNPQEINSLGITDETWTNLCINGASLEEACEMFWLTVENGKDIRKVRFLVDLWVALYTPESRVAAEKSLALSSWNYLSFPDSHKEVLDTIRKTVLNAVSGNKNTTQPATSKKETYREMAERMWNTVLTYFPYSDESANRLIEVIEYCQENDIDIQVFTLPVRKELYEYIEEKNRTLDYVFYKDLLSSVTRVYDMEYPESCWSEDETFADVSHFSDVRELLSDNFADEHPMLMDIFAMMFQNAGEEVQILSDRLSVEKFYEVNDIHLSGDKELQTFYGPQLPLEPDSFYIVSCEGNVNEADEASTAFYMDFYTPTWSDLYKSTTAYSNSRNYVIFNLNYLLNHEGTCWAASRTWGLDFEDYYFRVVYQGEKDLNIDHLTIYKYTGWEKPKETIEGWPELNALVDTILKKNKKKADILKDAFTPDPVYSEENIYLPGDRQVQAYGARFPLEPNSTYLVACEGSLTTAKSIGNTFYMDIYAPDLLEVYPSIEAYIESPDSITFYPERVGGDSVIYWTIFKTDELLFDEYLFRVVYQGAPDLNIDWLAVYKIA